MAHTVRELKPHKGYPITKINQRYVSTDPVSREQFGADSLKEIKERIDAKISVRKLSKKLGELLLPPR